MLFRRPIGPLMFCCAALALVSLRPAVAGELAPEQRRAIESVIHDYLLQHPDVLIEALRAGEEKVKSDAGKNARQALVARRSEVFDDPETPVGGNPKGDVTLVEFFDYRCPYCKQVQPRLRDCSPATTSCASPTRSFRSSARCPSWPPAPLWRRFGRANTRRFTMR
jgi:protein-disulfide isomerase